MKEYKLLMLTTLIISGCSICYELIISAVSSYLVGDTVLQYSVTIGLYMFAMGIGSYISKFIKRNLFNWFVFIEMGVGLFGGTCSCVLFYSNLYLNTYQIIMYIEIIIIGTFVGAEIPILTRIIESGSSDLSVTLSSIFSFDYIGGLLGSILFPLLLLPKLGYFTTSFLVGVMNIVAAALIIFKYSDRILHAKAFRIAIGVLLAAMFSGMLFADNISENVEGGLYRDRVILSEHTPYQHIVMTKHKDDVRLYIDGNTQFCSKDEYRYHEALVHIPMSAASKKGNVLVLGGGDGLAVRELLKYENTHITLVDLDEKMIQISRENPNINELNEHSLDSDRLSVVIGDAYQYLVKVKEKFDVIIVDLPDPNNETLNKLYTNIFYRLCYGALTDEGVVVVQSTSPYYATDAFWCINKTLESEKFYVTPYHLEVASFGDWGFNMGTKNQVKLDDIDINVPTKYLSNDNAASLFMFGKDEISYDKITVNTLSKPVLIEYYSRAVRNWG